jgi:hypothetical protein
MKVNMLCPLALAVTVAATLIGCATVPPVPPVQQQASAKPIRWGCIFMVQSASAVGWHSCKSAASNLALKE